MPANITFINLSNDNENKNIKGKIILSHCKNHDCIILYFDFDGFYNLHERLLSKKFLADEKKSRLFKLIKGGFFPIKIR